MYSITPIQLFGLYSDVLIFCINNTSTNDWFYLEAKVNDAEQTILKIRNEYPNSNFKGIKRLKNVPEVMALYEILLERNATEIKL